MQSERLKSNPLNYLDAKPNPVMRQLGRCPHASHSGTEGYAMGQNILLVAMPS